jgi:hypothetical protein
MFDQEAMNFARLGNRELAEGGYFILEQGTVLFRDVWIGC